MTTKNSFKKGGMFEGASHLVFANAAQLRKKMTAAENVLWLHLRDGISGCKFRRQHPMGIYIADFYCHKAKLIIEVDGSIHTQLEIEQHDEERQKHLTEMGYQVIRFTNEAVMKQIETVLQKITKIVNTIIHKQSPNSGVKSPA